MFMNVMLDEAQIAKAISLIGINEMPALLRLALQSLIERESARQLSLLGGSEPTIMPVPRRRAL
ncbi:hypothetical protein BH10ACI4_BH10ACI4_14390 [soil metagenome]